MGYNLNVNSPDFVQRDGTALVNAETVINGGTARRGGNVSARGPLDAIDVVTTNDTTYGGSVVGGVGNNVGAASWTNTTTTGAVTQASSPYAGKILMTENFHGKTKDQVVKLKDSSDVYSGAYRIMNIVSANTYVLNGAYKSNVSSVTVSKPSSVSSTDSTIKPIGYLKAGRYAVRGITMNTYNGSTTIDSIGSPGSDRNRRKVNSVASVRTKLIETAIRNGTWNIYSGVFETTPGTQNDFSAFGADDAVANDSENRGLKGEYAYRYGLTVSTGDYS